MLHDRTIKLIAFLVLLCAGFLLYFQSLNYQFSILDDLEYVVENTDIRRIDSGRIQNWFSNEYVLNYIPITIASYAFDYQIWKLRPFGYRFTNLLLHCFNSFLIFLIIWRITGNLPISFSVSLIFILHPVQIESVAWMAERKNVLAAFFAFISTIFFLKDKFLVSFCFFFFALLSKPNVVVVPVVFFVYDYLFGRLRLNIPKRIMFYGACLAGSTIIAVVTIAFHIETEIVLRGGSFLRNFYVMTTVFFRYIALLLFPNLQQAYYLTKVYQSFFEWPVLLSSLGILSIGTCMMWLRKKEPQICFWLLWYIIFLLPVSNIVAPIATLMHDRYLYLPLAGFFTAAFLIIQKLSNGFFFRAKSRRKIIATLCIVSLVILPTTALSWSRLPMWKTSEELFSHEITSSNLPDPRTHFMHGASLLRSGNIDQSIQEFDRTLEFMIDERTLLMQAQNYLQKELPEQAVLYLLLYDRYFKDRGSMRNIGLSIYADYYMQLNEFHKAEQNLLESISLKKKVTAYLQLGRLYYNTNRAQQAIETLKQALEIDPDSYGALGDLCFYYLKEGLYPESYEIYKRLYDLNPQNPFVLEISKKLKNFKSQ